MSDRGDEGDSVTMAPEQWLGALADAWDLGHEVCEFPNCLRKHVNPYRVRASR